MKSSGDGERLVLQSRGSRENINKTRAIRGVDGPPVPRDCLGICSRHRINKERKLAQCTLSIHVKTKFSIFLSRIIEYQFHDTKNISSIVTNDKG